MKISLELTRDDAVFFLEQLRRHVAEIDDELIHTDCWDLQRALAADAARMRRISDALEQRLEAYDDEERFFDDRELESEDTDARLHS